MADDVQARAQRAAPHLDDLRALADALDSHAQQLRDIHLDRWEHDPYMPPAGAELTALAARLVDAGFQLNDLGFVFDGRRLSGP